MACSASVALIYLARGADEDHLDRIRRFLASYAYYRAGVSHRLYVIVKGYRTLAKQETVLALFAGLDPVVVETDDNSFDLGAYALATRQVGEEFTCYLNTNAEIAADDWLLKLALNLEQPLVGAVSATGSYESLQALGPDFYDYPNPHLRSNAFMVRTPDGTSILSSIAIETKADAYMLESGSLSITRKVMQRGLIPLVVGKDGRGYGPQWWPDSATFRSGLQENLLVHDNVTRAYQIAPVTEKLELMRRTWQDLRAPVDFAS